MAKSEPILDRRQFNFVVIGSGAGGMVTAITLARNGRNVLLLEEGHEKTNAEPFSLDEIHEYYRSSRMAFTLGNSPVGLGEGTALGGGTSINSGYYLRPDAEKINQFARKWKIDGLSAESLKADFEALEEDLNPLALEISEHLKEHNWRKAAASLGLKVTRPQFVHRWKAKEGSFVRRSAFDTWSRDLLGKGAVIRSGHRVNQVKKYKNSWEGRGRRRSSAGAWKAFSISCDCIFICTGATETPALLRRSGIKANVGNNLRFQAFVRLLARLSWP